MTSVVRHLPLVALGLAILACNGRDATGSRGTPPAPTRIEDRSGEGENKIAGSVRGAPFSHVAAAFVIESPEAEGTTLIYLLSGPLRCLDLSFEGWDRALADGTMILALSIFGKAPGSFLVVANPTLTLREGSAGWTRTSARGDSSEVRSSGGWITIDSLAPEGSATGSFELSFDSGQLTGRFSAAFCPGGGEP